MKTQVYLIGTSVVFYSYNTVGPVATFLRSVPSALLTIDNAPVTGYIQFSQKDNNGGLPSPFLSAPLADIVDAVGTTYTSITTLIAAITPAAGGGGGGTAPDIATYDVQYDIASGAAVRVLTVFDPVTNAPTRTFTALDGSPFVPSNPLLVASFDTGFATSNNILLTYIERRLGNIMTAARIVDNTPSSDPQPEMTIQQSIFTAPSGGGDITFNTVGEAYSTQIIALTGEFTMDGTSGTITYPITTASGGKSDDFKLVAPFGRTLPAISFTVIDGSSVLLIQSIALI